MDSKDVKKLRALSGLLRELAEIRPTCTVRQLDAVIAIILSGGMTRAKLAREINMTEGSVTRLVQDFGPTGSKCLETKGDKVVMHPDSMAKWRRYLDA